MKRGSEIQRPVRCSFATVGNTVLQGIDVFTRELGEIEVYATGKLCGMVEFITDITILSRTLVAVG